MRGFVFYPGCSPFQSRCTISPFEYHRLDGCNLTEEPKYPPWTFKIAIHPLSSFLFFFFVPRFLLNLNFSLNSRFFFLFILIIISSLTLLSTPPFPFFFNLIRKKYRMKIFQLFLSFRMMIPPRFEFFFLSPIFFF